MEPALVDYLAQIAALQAESDGMKALNTFREMRGETIAYFDGNFFEISDKLKKISEAIGKLYSQ